MKITSSKLYAVYLALVSFVALVAIAINLWIVLTSVWQYLLITDDEYLQNREYYKIEQCENTNLIRSVENIELKTVETVQLEKTDEEIEECKEKVRVSVSASRSYNMKDMFISSWAWMIVFLIIFSFHYPKFLKIKN